MNIESNKKTADFFPIFLNIPPENIVLLKALLESYDELGILRTLNRSTGDVVVLSLEDARLDLEQLLQSLKSQLNLRFLEEPPTWNEDWLLRSLENESAQQLL